MARPKKSVTEKPEKPEKNTEANGRGSPEAVEKRRVARRLNELLSAADSSANPLDGRTAKRRQRLLEELRAHSEEGGDKLLKPIDLLQNLHELLELGEPIASLRKLVKVRKSSLSGEEAIELLKRLDAAYHFQREVYRFLGLPEETLVAAGLTEESAPKKKRGRPRKHPVKEAE